MRLVAMRLFSIILVVVGGVLLYGGLKLTSLGGSPYYLLAGAGILASGLLLAFRRQEGIALYAVILFATLAWAIWEVGFDGWALIPRVGAPVLLAVVLFSPWHTRMLRGRGALSITIVIAALVVSVGAGGALRAARSAGAVDPIFQAGTTAPSAETPIAADEETKDWPVWGYSAGGSRFSPLTQINPANVGKLKVAWIYHTGGDAQGHTPRLSVTPIKVGQSLYLCTAWNDIISLDVETGKERWRARSGAQTVPPGTCRGVAYYRVPNGTGACAARVITNTVDARLIAVDADTGERCADFGTNGEASLLTGMGPVEKMYYFVSSAPTIVRGRIVFGGWIYDGQYWGEPSGVIRAFDAVTGRFSWAFDVGRLDRQTEPPPGESYTLATPNSWAPMSADETIGLVYAPTGTATPDYFGGKRRPFDDQYSSATVAIDAETGKLRWAFQTTHHDLWDYDVGAQPTLVDLPNVDGGVRHALVQATKSGQLFVLDRESGEPISPVEERPVSARGHVAGERVAPTQPFSVGMPSLAGSVLTEDSMWGISPLDQLWCRIRFRESRYDGPMTPPGLTPSIEYPGYVGGVDWGSVAIDTDRHIMVVNGNRMAVTLKLLPRAEADRMGLKPFSKEHPNDVHGGAFAQAGTPYGAIISPFFSPLAIPCQAPPFGTLNGIDLITHKLIWTRPLGSADAEGPLGIPSHLPFTIGVGSFGGPITTRSGLTFIAATQDGHFRAFETRTGRLLWDVTLPAGGHANPMTYQSSQSGRQFVVIAASGFGLLHSKLGDDIVAYALPR